MKPVKSMLLIGKILRPWPGFVKALLRQEAPLKKAAHSGKSLTGDASL